MPCGGVRRSGQSGGLGSSQRRKRNPLREFTRQWQDYALAFPERGKAEDELWTVYGLLRGWMLSPERLPKADQLVAHKAAGDFLRELINQKRANELGMMWVVCLIEARQQFLKAGEYQDARIATGGISRFLRRNGLYQELIRLNEEILSYEAHPVTMMWLGRGHLDQAFYFEARDWYERALTASNEMPKETALSLHNLATVDLYQGNYMAARKLFQRALEIWRRIGDFENEAQTLNNLASIDLHEGNHEVARQQFRRALEIWRQIDERLGEAQTLHNLATIEAKEGNNMAARELFLQALAIKRQIGDPASEATTLQNLATIDLNERNYQPARLQFHRALEIKRQIGDRAGEANILHQLATIDLEEGDYPASLKQLRRLLEFTQQSGDRTGEAFTFHQLGTISWKTGQRAESALLIALGFLLAQAIGISEAQTFKQNLAAMVGQLGYTPEQIQAMLAEVAQEYARDRGAGLVRAAFDEY